MSGKGDKEKKPAEKKKPSKSEKAKDFKQIERDVGQILGIIQKYK